MSTRSIPKSKVNPKLKLTDAQLRVLRWLDPKEYNFPTGSQTGVCFTLSSKGLAEGEMQPAEWDSRKGITRYLRAFRRSVSGEEFLKTIDKK